MEDRYQATLDKKNLIQRLGFTFIEIWSCELDEWLADSADARKFFKAQTGIIDPLDPRDALFGGRVCPVRLSYQPKEGEEIRYADICR